MWFQKSESKLWTWKSPDGLTKNQIDYILTSKRYFNAVLDVNAIQNADCGSDHNPVVVKLPLRLIVKHSGKAPERID